jgi:hypothetical protein
MTDRELLELAAKAYGIDHWYGKEGTIDWNPLEDDGDALRLAVKLGLEFQYYCRWGDDVEVVDCSGELEALGSDPYRATRRAIVRAAAKLGERQ